MLVKDLRKSWKVIRNVPDRGPNEYSVRVLEIS